MPLKEPISGLLHLIGAILTLPAVIILIIFGAGKLPEIGAGMGKAIRNFKGATTDAEEKEKEKLKEGNSS